MSQSTFSIRMEENLKTQFEGLCDSFGMNMNTAFNVFARAVVRERRIPFELTAEIPNAKTLAAMKETEEILTHPENYKSYSSFEEILKEVN